MSSDLVGFRLPDQNSRFLTRARICVRNEVSALDGSLDVYELDLKAESLLRNSGLANTSIVVRSKMLYRNRNMRKKSTVQEGDVNIDKFEILKPKKNRHAAFTPPVALVLFRYPKPDPQKHSQARGKRTSESRGVIESKIQCIEEVRAT